MQLGHASPKSMDSLDGHSDEIASPDKDVEGDHNGDVGACGEEHSQTKVWRVTTMASPALKRKRTSLDGHSDEIASPDKDVEGDDNGDVGASPALKEKRTLSDMYEGLVGPDLGRKLPVGCAKLKNLPPSTKATLVAILAELTPVVVLPQSFR